MSGAAGEGGRRLAAPPSLVLFDLGYVLVDIDLDRARARWRDLAGPGAAPFDAVFFESGLKAHMDRAPLGLPDLVRRVNAAAGTALEAEAILDAWNACLLPTPAALALAQRAAERARVGVLSDTDPFHAAFIQALPDLAASVEHWTFSFEVGACKPSAATWETALARFGEPAERALFVDDKPENVDAARDLGLDAVVFEGVEALERALIERGVL